MSRFVKLSGSLIACFVLSGFFLPQSALSATKNAKEVEVQTSATKTEEAKKNATEEAAETEKSDAVEGFESGPRVTTQQHGDWLLECYEPALNGVNCQIKQRIVQQDTEQNILVISLAYEPDSKANIIQYVLPLDFLITPGVSVEVDQYQTVAGVNRCSAQGCYIEGTADDNFVDAMKNSKVPARVVIVSRTGQKIGINFSAKGFTKAFDQMVRENVSSKNKEPVQKK